ncbi:dolichyl-phosphate beta-glucosyltransferase isoform X2 [Sipha flava]|nr:dolichyl-phosphate beta-glucosyltransferase isoform X2 [Sipha flava]
MFLKKSPDAYKYRTDEELYFVDEHGKRIKFPKLSDEPVIDLSVIVPAYNEQDRLKPMLDSCLRWLSDRKSSFEVIIVSDGSTDKTCDVVMKYVINYGANRVRLLKLVKNRGKGGAVGFGMQSARGRTLLFADADGATQFEDLEKLETALQSLIESADYDNSAKNNDIQAVVCGSRAHLESEAKAQRSIFRTLLMMAFHIHVWMFGVRSIKDTQCGFKLFTRSAARVLFNNLHVDRWAFDVEILYIAEKMKMSLAEVAVNWTEIDGSKIVPVWSWLQMGFDVLEIWLRYRTGSWKIQYKPE